MSESETAGRVTVQRDADGVAWIVFDNPPRRNAFNRDMFVQLRTACLDLDADPSVRVLVVRGGGTAAFSAGADIGELGSRLGPERYADGAERTRDDSGALALLAVTKPVIAMIHGFCIGGGLLIAMTADLRYCSDDAQFGVPAGRLGIGYPTVGMRLLANLVGPAHAAEIAFTAGRYSAAEATAIGLVNKSCSSADLETHVRQVARVIAAQAPLSLRAAKAAIGAIGRGWQAEDVARAEQAVRECWNSDDFFEGRRAFAEKRAAQFTGK